MVKQQSYNHFMPQSLMKNGWGFQSKASKYKSIMVLDYEKLRTFVKRNSSFSKIDIVNNIKQSYTDIDLLHANRNNIITRKKSTSFMGNKLVLNLTEDKFGKDKININGDIENIIIDATKNNYLHNINIDLIYKWAALQKSRSIFDLMKWHDFFLENMNISKINNKSEYLNFKSFYNEYIHEGYDHYYDDYLQNRCSTKIIDFKKSTGNDCFLVLGSLNTLSTNAFSSMLKGTLQNYQIKLLPFIDISLVSKNQAIVLYPTAFNEHDIEIIVKNIATYWNAYQIQQENDKLIVNYKNDDCINHLIDMITLQQKNGYLNYNLNNQQDYLNLLNMSDQYEDE